MHNAFSKKIAVFDVEKYLRRTQNCQKLKNWPDT